MGAATVKLTVTKKSQYYEFRFSGDTDNSVRGQVCVCFVKEECCHGVNDSREGSLKRISVTIAEKLTAIAVVKDMSV